MVRLCETDVDEYTSSYVWSTHDKGRLSLGLVPVYSGRFDYRDREDVGVTSTFGERLYEVDIRSTDQSRFLDFSCLKFE